MLLEQVAEFENLSLAFHECSKGKRNSFGYREALFAYGEQLKRIEGDLLSGSFNWSGYRKFYVRDPKKREIMAAPFIDRVVHHAIHRKIEPIIDPLLSDSVFACRRNKGNRNAVISLYTAIKSLGPDRFAIKLDVSKYFNSIDHEALLHQLKSAMPDDSLNSVIKSLLNSNEEFARSGQGIPIGNLTSQLFANFYLRPVDEIVIKSMGCDYYWKIDVFKKGFFYIRYMDDLVLIGRDKNQVLDAAYEAISCAQRGLKLKIPIHKRVPLGCDPIPFLGFVVDHGEYRILSRNRRRLRRKLKILIKKQARPSLIARVKTSFDAWGDLKINGEGS